MIAEAATAAGLAYAGVNIGLLLQINFRLGHAVATLTAHERRLLKLEKANEVRKIHVGPA